MKLQELNPNFEILGKHYVIIYLFKPDFLKRQSGFNIKKNLALSIIWQVKQANSTQLTKNFSIFATQFFTNSKPFF